MPPVVISKLFACGQIEYIYAVFTSGSYCMITEILLKIKKCTKQFPVV